MKRGNIRACTIVIGTMLALTPVLPAQTPGPAASKQADEIARTLMSPYCPGLTLATCPSAEAATLRREMADRLEHGETREDVVASLVERFGSQVTGVPEKQGIGALAWVIPPVAAGVMLGGIYLLGRRRQQSDQPDHDTVTTDRAAQIDDELDRLDG